MHVAHVTASDASEGGRRVRLFDVHVEEVAQQAGRRRIAGPLDDFDAPFLLPEQVFLVAVQRFQQHLRPLLRGEGGQVPYDFCQQLHFQGDGVGQRREVREARRPEYGRQDETDGAEMPAHLQVLLRLCDAVVPLVDVRVQEIEGALAAERDQPDAAVPQRGFQFPDPPSRSPPGNFETFDVQ